MEIKAKIISNEIKSASGYTIWKDSIDINLKKMLKSEHSPIRTILFKIEMIDIPSFVSVHLTRHSQTGELHFVSSCREDRGFKGTANRNTPVRHMMILNAQHIINISKVRLCKKSHKKTREVWQLICQEVIKEMPELLGYLMPSCLYRNGCPEFKSCGYYKELKQDGYLK